MSTKTNSLDSVVMVEEQINSIGLKLYLVRPDADLVAVSYLQMKVEGILGQVYYQSIPPLMEYMNWHLNPRNVWLACMACRTCDNAQPELAGMGWINQITDTGLIRRGDVGMMFFRKFQQRSITREFTEQLIDYAFDVARLDVIHGMTPEPNRAALAFSRRMGFMQYGPIPLMCHYAGVPCAGVMSVMTKQDWNRRRRNHGRTEPNQYRGRIGAKGCIPNS
jgi:RimJ/RimL family protein N-acetyltransferase